MTVEPRRATPALLQIDAILTRLRGVDALSEVCRFLRAEFAPYRWVGVYRLEGNELSLVAWDGDQPTEHTRIPVQQGICGKAVREDRTIVVDDVRSSPEYLACFLTTRSEIVVPVRTAGTLVGEIDVDGDVVKAFDATDGRFLESVGARIAAALAAAVAPAPTS